jgi:polysaccharide export outer membrane protein
MTTNRRWLSPLWVAAWMLSTVGAITPQSRAQDTGAAQADLLRSISPEQREALLDRVLGNGGISGQGGVMGAPVPLQGDPALGQLLRDDREEADTDNGVPVLKLEDLIIIEIDFDLPDALVPAVMPDPVAAPQPPAATSMTGAVAPSMPLASRAPVNPDLLPPDERQRLERAIEQIRAKNPYKLSTEGVLYLPGFSGIPLAGLTEEKAALRLRSEPALNKLEVRVTRMPLKGSGVEALKPFGYDLFDSRAALFMANSGVPVPAHYVMGPGDTLEVQLYGGQNATWSLVVGRDGVVRFPELGPISVGGSRFEDVRRDIESRVASQMIGVRANVSMGAVRGIQIFVVGEARAPGSYTVSGLATITTALYAAGGVTHVGSLRDVQLKRQGALVGRLDLYDLLLNGDTSRDAKLLDGDAIFIPPVGPTVSVDGAVQRPAIYELRGATAARDIIQLAGGLTPEADTSKTVLTRIDENRRRVVLEADIGPGGGNDPLRNGDALRVARLHPTLDLALTVEGHAYTTGPVAWRSGLRLSQVIRSIDDLQPNADIHYVLVRREASDRRISVLSADLAAALRDPGSENDIELMPRDRILVFDKEAGRERVIRPLLEELRLQGSVNEPTAVVRIDGNAKAPGEYPLEPGMRVSDLIRAGGSLEDAAFDGSAELTRYQVNEGQSRSTQLIKIDLAAALRGERDADIMLQPYDSVSIKRMPYWRDRETVELAGEVRFPGVYEIRQGETLRSVITRAGGLSTFAFPAGSVFTREELKRREEEQLNTLADRLQTDLSTLALQGVAANQSQAAAALSVGQSLLSQLRTTKAVGRLVIDVQEVLGTEPGAAQDIVLHHGDRLIVPKLRQEIMVLGEVQNSTSHLYQDDLHRDDYIGLSGGVTRKADRSRIYVVRADGSVVANQGSRWFRNGGSPKMQPGDTVVVPLDTDRLPALPFWQSVTQILYNLAIPIAAIGRL